jgi:hypothetical protein
MGSAFNADICDAIAASGMPDGLVHERIANWPGIADNTGDAVPLRLTGALHRLVLDDLDEELAAVYPPARAKPSDATEAIWNTLGRHERFIVDYLSSPPQTNEVGRSAILYPAFLWLAARHLADFEILEIGASAGLNQNFDRYHIDYQSWQAGDPLSPVQISCKWQGAPLPERSRRFRILDRSASDIEPVAIQTPAQRARLISYVWPDQSERLARIEAALDLTALFPPKVERAAAADWLSDKLAQPRPARHLVIMHTVMWQYLPLAERARAEALIRGCGRRASANAPLSWLRFEADGSAPGGGILLTSWAGTPEDGITRCLGRADFHGRWVEWQG